MNTDKIYAQTVVNEYSVKDTRKVVSLKKLDAKAKLPATIFTYTFGVIATLVFGTGMCLAMKVIGDGRVASVTAGVIIGLVGMACTGLNYPIYKKIKENGKKKYASDIIRLAKEITDENE